LSAAFVAFARLFAGRLRERDFLKSRFAFSRVSVEVVPLLGGGNFTPARRALDNPIAIACSGERAPCLPSRT